MAIVVHIGYPKTGSTTLQRHVFPKLAGCDLAFPGDGDAFSPFRLLLSDLMYADDGSFLEQTVRSYLEERERRSPGVLLVSHEGLSGKAYQGALNRHRNAERLFAVAPHAKVLMTVRHQGTMIRSLYSQHLLHGGYGSFPEFLGGRTPDGDHFDPEHLRYDTLLASYLDLFGPERVKAMAYETLIRNPAEFLTDLYDFVGLHPGRDAGLEEPPNTNRSLSPVSRRVVRRCNELAYGNRTNPRSRRLAVRGAQRMGRVLQNRVDPKLFANVGRDLSPRDDDLLTRVLARFEEGNARLAALSGLPLSDLGYPLPAPADRAAPTTATH